MPIICREVEVSRMRELSFWEKVLYGLFDFEIGPNTEASIVLMSGLLLLMLFMGFKVLQYHLEDKKKGKDNGDKT